VDVRAVSKDRPSEAWYRHNM